MDTASLVRSFRAFCTWWNEGGAREAARCSWCRYEGDTYQFDGGARYCSDACQEADFEDWANHV